MTSEIHHCFRALELEPGASLDEVKQARRDLTRVWHPDRFTNDARMQRKGEERLKEINQAYVILEQYLATASPLPPSGRPTRSSSAATGHHATNQQQYSQKAWTGAPPRQPIPAKPTASPEPQVYPIFLGIYVCLAVVAFALLVLVFLK